MIEKYLIATVCGPRKGHKQQFVDMICNWAKENFDCKVLAMKAAGGPGCWNLALKVEGEKSDSFIQSLTYTLQPGKYCLCFEDFDGFDLTIWED